MMKTVIATAALIAAFATNSLMAEELELGSKAPKLELKKFLKGDEVKGFEKGKIYVVELWATWCPPCRATIPHLTKLQKQYEDVVFIGVAVMERDQSSVADFVDEMGKQMDYRVALDLVPEDGDPEEGKTVKNWMEPAGLPGLPSAFVVNGEGKIAWIGHPGEIEEPLEQIVEGKWDLVAEAKKISVAKALEKKMAAVLGKLEQLFGKFKEDGDPQSLLAELDTAADELPEKVSILQLIRFKVLVLAKDKTDDAVNLGNKILESEDGQDIQLLDNLAWMIVAPERDTKASPKLLKLALKVAVKADNLAQNENPSVADTLAKAYFDNGDLAKAVKTQERVIELAEGTRMAADPGIKKRLRQYKKALDASTKADDAGSKSSKNE